MLDNQDLQAIAQLLAQQKADIIQDVKAMLQQQKTEILQESTHNMKVLLETEVTTKFNLIAEDTSIIRERMTTQEDVDDLQDQIDTHRDAIKRHSREIKRLESEIILLRKAQ